MKFIYNQLCAIFNGKLSYLPLQNMPDQKRIFGKSFLLAVITIASIAALPSISLAQGQSTFVRGTNMLTFTNYSPAVLPNALNDVLVTTPNSPINISSAGLTVQSFNVTNGSSYVLGDSTSVANQVLTVGNTSTFTNLTTGSSTNDIFFLLNNSSLTIQPKVSTGNKSLSVALASNGNFDITSGSSLTFSSPITDNGNGFGITKTGGGLLSLLVANTLTGPITVDSGFIATQNSTTDFGSAAPTINLSGGGLRANLAMTYSSTNPITITGNGSFDDNGNAVSITSLVTGTGSLTKIGAGTLTVTCNVGGATGGTYTGSTFIQQGILKNGRGGGGLPATTAIYLGQSGTANLATFDLNTRAQTIAGLNSVPGTNATASSNIVTNALTGTPLLTIAGSGSYTFGNGTPANSGVITGPLALTMSGTGLQTLGGVNSYTGATIINGGGELRFATPAASSQSLSAVTLSNASKLTTTGSGASSALTFSSLVMSSSATINLETSVAHTLTFTALGAFTGTLTINGWQGSYHGTSGTAGQIFIGSSAILSAGQLAQIQFINGATTYGAIQLTTGEIVPYTFVAETDFFQSTNMLIGLNYTSGVVPIAGNDILITAPNNTLNISSASITAQSLNAKNGGIYVIGDSGIAANQTLTLGNASSFTNSITGSSANDIFYVAGNTSLTLQPTVGPGTKILGVTLAGSGNFDVTTGSTLAVSSIITDGGNGYAITKTGGGTLALSAANTFTGITINGGVVSSTNGNSNLGTYPGGVISNYITINGGTLQAAGIFTPSVNRGIFLGTSGGTFDNNGFAMNFTNAPGVVISGPGSFTKIGAGTFTNSTAATYTGNTFIQQDIFKCGVANVLPLTTTLYLGQATTANLGTLDMNTHSQSVVGLNSVPGTNASALNNTVTSATGAAVLTITGSGSYAFGDGTTGNSGVITGTAGIKMAGTGLQIIGGINTYTGVTTFTSGELRFVIPGGLSQTIGAASFGGGTFSTVGSTAGSSITFSSLGMTASSIINLETSNAHTVTFTAAGALTGTLTINGWQGSYHGTPGTTGKLFVGSSAILTAAQLLQIKFVNGAVTYPATQLPTGEVVPYILTQETDFFQSSNMLVAQNYTEGVLPTNVNDILLTTPVSTINISTANLVGESLNAINGNTYTIGDSTATTRKLTLGNASFTNAITGSSANDIFYLSGNSSVTLQPNVLSGTGGGLTVSLASSSNIDVTTGSTLAISSIISGAFGITKTGGGLLALSGANTFTGATAINGGVVAAINGTSNFGNGTAPTISINGGTIRASAASLLFNSTHAITIGAGGATFDDNGNKISITSPLSGTGSFTKMGVGALTMTCNLGATGATYTGNTFVLQDTLKNGRAGGGLPATTVVYLGQAATTNLGILDVNIRAQTIAGLNSVTGTNASALLSNAVTNSGATSVILTINGSGSYAFGSGSTTNSGIINGLLGITMSGSGLQILGGINSYTGLTTFAAGDLRFNTPGAATQTLTTATFSGGKLSTFGTSAASTINFTTLTLTGSSKIALDSTVANTVKFSAAGGFTSGKVLTIIGWQGTIGTVASPNAGTTGRLFITAAIGTKISQIQFLIGGVNYGATQIVATGEIVPVSNPTLITGTLSGATFCAGSSVVVNFTYSPTSSFTGATFTVQLSNNSFTTFTALQSTPSNSTGAQSITATIPVSTTIGGGYKIRVVTTTVLGTPSTTVFSVGGITWIGGATGHLTDWNTANWCSNSVPDITASVTIPVGGGFYPNITGTSYVNSITISAGASVQIASGGLFSVHGTITNNGVLDATAGTLQMAGSAGQTIAGSMFNTTVINNLVDSNTSVAGLSLTSGDPINITGQLSFGYTTAKLVTNNGLILISNATNTASVGQIVENGSGVAQANIAGNVTVQRYYQAHRRWRLITSPVNASGAPTISAAWQEGAQDIAGDDADPNPGFGTDISGPTTGAFNASTGYDQSATNSASIAKLTAANSWFSIPNTFLSVNTYQGYMLFVRGDRSFPIYTGTATTPATDATLRTTGLLNTGRVTVPVNTGFTVVGNPYAATINFNKVYANSATAVTSNSFSLWDPNIGSAANVAAGTGGWVTLTWDNLTSTYDASPDPTMFDGFDTNGDIQSGAAYAVDGTGVGSVQMDETNKVTGTDSHLYLFRPSGSGTTPELYMLRTTLYSTDTTNAYLADGVLNEFSSDYTNDLNYNKDVKKLFSFNERVSILKSGQNLSIQKSAPPEAGDTVHFVVSSLKQSPYQLVIGTNSFARPDLKAFLIDSFTNISTPVLLGDTSTTVNFTVTADPASYAADRFSVVFAEAPGSVTYTSVTATQENKNIAVEWVVDNQLNISKYVVEKSTDGVNFYPVDTTIATTTSSSTYDWLDVNTVIGHNYYRIRSIDNTGAITYSKTVDVIMGKGIIAGMQIYPNPVTDGTLELQMNNVPAGEYGIKIMSTSGQVILTETIDHGVSSETHPILLNKQLADGIYILEVIHPDKTITKINFENQ